MGPVGDVLISSLGGSIIVELGLHTGFELGVKVFTAFINTPSLHFLMGFSYFTRSQTTCSLLIL
jgi:hypothetical protein